MRDGTTRLREVGLRVTSQRLAVLSVLDRARRQGEHLTVPDVASRCREILGEVGTQTVYDCLTALSTGGLVRHIALPGGVARFESSVGPEHHHLVCDACGRIVNVPGAAGTVAPGLVERAGFDVSYVDTVHVGRCRRCRTEAVTPPRR
jgi:Fur family ferric uptake transcriptional regulator